MAGKSRYDTVAIILHWLIAIAILSMIPMGWWMGDAIKEPSQRALAFQVFQIHKSIGLTILVLSVLRLAWRLTHKAPPLPAHMPAWEKLAARATHVVFYFLMIALPFTGWAFVSAGWSLDPDMPFRAPTIWFGLIEVPHLPFVANLDDAGRRATAFNAMAVHGKLAWGALILAGIHVAAALKHHIFDKDAVLHHMLPLVKAPARDARGD